MKLLLRIGILFGLNILTFVILAYLIPDIHIDIHPTALLNIAALFTAINLILKPIAKLLFSALIVITLGLFILVINAGTLWLLDFLSQSISINGLVPFLSATLILSLTNGFASALSKGLTR